MYYAFWLIKALLTYSNKCGETPIHCAAYNEVDSGALLELLMQTCTDDIRQQTLQLRNADQVYHAVGHSIIVSFM